MEQAAQEDEKDEKVQPKPKRKYEKVWDALAVEPGKTIKVKVKNRDMIPRIRKGVQKEKDICTTVSKDGFPIKKLYRLDVEVLEDGLTLVFKLVRTAHIGNL